MMVGLMVVTGMGMYIPSLFGVMIFINAAIVNNYTENQILEQTKRVISSLIG